MLAERENILEEIKNKQIIRFETDSAYPDFIDKVDKTLTSILQVRKYPHLKIPLAYVFREFITNAEKANLKRIFFKLNDLYIDVPEDYNKGSIAFKQALQEDIESLRIRQRDYRKNIAVVFQKYSDDEFTAFIINNSVITSQEAAGINDKIKKYLVFKKMSEPYFGNAEEEASEGAGLGIYLTLQILDQVGINSTAIRIGAKDKQTISKISFKYSQVAPPPYNELAKEILKTLETLPKFPANIKSILTKLLDPDVSVMDVADQVQTDPSLSADVLKLVNSAQFALTRKIASIKEAVNFLGIKGLKGILYSYGSMQVLNDSFGTVAEVWDHSYEVGAYASKLSKIMNLKKEEETIFSAGLLHDIGKIVLMTFDKEKAKNIEKVCEQKGMELPILEEIMMGLSHAIIGGKIAEHWDFPQSLIDAITHHHEPLLSGENKEVIYTVYMANHFSNNKHIEDLNYNSLETEVKDFFQITNHEDLLNLFEKVKRLM